MLKLAVALVLSLSGVSNENSRFEPDDGDYCPSWKFVPAIRCENDWPCHEVLAHLNGYDGECWVTSEIVRITPRVKFI